MTSILPSSPNGKSRPARTLKIRQSHGGSSKQARSVAEGLPADVVTFNQVTDIELLHKAGLVGADWRQRLPNNACAVLFAAGAAGARRQSQAGEGLERSRQARHSGRVSQSQDVRATVVTPISPPMRMPWRKTKATKPRQKDFVTRLLANVPVFDTGGRGASTTFIERGIGDVLVTFESEITAIRREYGKSNLQAVIPSMSLRADFPVAVVDKVVDRKNTREAATAYLKYLYSPAGQDIIAKHYNRVNDANVPKKYAAQFPAIKLVTVDEAFGGWDKVIKTHFADGGILDQALAKAPAR